jgi:hypothetical protein
MYICIYLRLAMIIMFVSVEKNVGETWVLL